MRCSKERNDPPGKPGAFPKPDGGRRINGGGCAALSFTPFFPYRLSVQGKCFDGTLVDLEKWEVVIALNCIGVGSLRRAFVGVDAIVGLTVRE